MSIAPVSSFAPDPSELAAKQVEGSVRIEASTVSGAATEATSSIWGSLPKQEVSPATNVASTYELPQDVVEVHQDSQVKDQLIVQYLDKAKNVVLQVPSSQELGVERGIAQDLQQSARLRAADSAAAGEKK